MELAIENKTFDHLKKMLISRDVKLQIRAVNSISKSIDREKHNFESFQNLINFYINNEFCVYLSEATVTLDKELLKKVIYCFRHLYMSSYFYNNCNCPYVTAALVRVANLHIKEENNESVVKSIVHFLCELFLRIGQNFPSDIMPSEGVYDTLQIMTLLNYSVDNDMTTHEIFMLCAKMLHSLLINKNIFIKSDTKVVENVSVTIQKYLEKLCNVLIENVVKSQNKNKISYTFGMICYIGIDAVEFCYILNKCQHIIVKKDVLNSDKLIVESSNDSLTNFEKTIEFAHKAILCVIGRLKDLLPYLTLLAHEILLKFVQIYLQNSFLENIAPEFSQFLVKNDFLIYLPRLRSSCQNHNIRKLSQSNLLELIVILSCQRFDLSQWDGGMRAFKNHIYEGLLNSYDDFNLWPKIFFDCSISVTTLNAIIIYFYFYCLNTEIPRNIAQLLLPALICYIQSISSNRKCPIPILKSLWLLFAITVPARNDISDFKIDEFQLEKANYKLSQLISLNIEDVYTHHISIIEWAYSLRVPFEIQCKVLSMWLNNEKELPSKFMSLAAVWWSLLEIVKSEVTTCLSSATEIFKQCLQNYCDEENALTIKTTLWKSLPEMLSVYIYEGKLRNEETLIHMLDLCTSQIPTKTDIIIVQNSAFLLITIIPMLKNCNERIFHFVLLEMLSLLSISVEHKNSLVLLRAINSKDLLELINEAIHYSSIFLSTIAYKILSFLVYYSTEFNLKSEISILIDLSCVVNTLKNERDDEKYNAILQLHYTVTKSMYLTVNKLNTSSLLYFPIDFDSDTTLNSFMSIFFRLQMVCCKESSTQAYSGWKCLNLMINLAMSTKNDKVIKKIASQPWTNTLIRFYTSQDISNVDMIFVEFIHSWLCCIDRYLKIKNITHKKAIFSKTINILMHTFRVKPPKELSDCAKRLIDDVIYIVNQM